MGIQPDSRLQTKANLKNSAYSVVVGAERDIASTVIFDVPADSPVMQEEVFGPILPVLEVELLLIRGTRFPLKIEAKLMD